MATNYQRGAAREREVIKIFKEAGWDAIRGAGSKGSMIGFKVDLVFSKTGRVNKDEAYLVLAQCKRSRIKK